MVKVDYDVAIGRNPQEVFDYITQVERIPEWQSQAGVKKVTRDMAVPLAVGSSFRMERESRGRTAAIDCRVTVLEPGREFDLRAMDSGGFACDCRTSVTRTSSTGSCSR